MQDDDRYGDAHLQRSRKTPAKFPRQPLPKTCTNGHRQDARSDTPSRAGSDNTTAAQISDMDWQPDEPIEIDELREFLADGFPLCAIRPAVFHLSDKITACCCSSMAQSFECAGETTALAEQLCAQNRITLEPNLLKSDAAMILIAALFNQGSLAFDDDDLDGGE